MPSILNPYIAGIPVGGKRGFYGRFDILQKVERYLGGADTKAILLLGQRRIGKTSLLMQIKNRINTNKYVAVYFDLMGKATQPMSEVLKELANRITIALHMKEKDFRFDNDGRIFQKEFLSNIYQSLPTTKHSIVILFDEFDVLDVNEHPAKNVAAYMLFHVLQRWMTEEDHLKFVFALGRDTRDIDQKFLATFRQGKAIPVSVLERSTTLELITSANEQIVFNDAAQKHIYELTHGHPYFTQLLCSEIFDQTSELDGNPPIIDEQIVERIIPSAFQTGDHVMAWVWEGLQPIERIVASILAEMLLKETSFIGESELFQKVREFPRLHDLGEMQDGLDRLTRLQLIETQSRRYRFMVPLFYQWVRSRKPIGWVEEELKSLDPEADQLNSLGMRYFEREDFAGAIDLYQRALQRNADHLRARKGLADAYLRLEKFDDAVQTYQDAYRRDPESARQGLTDTLMKRIDSRWDDISKEEDILNDIDKILQVRTDYKPALEKRDEVRQRRENRLYALILYSQRAAEYGDPESVIEKLASVDADDFEKRWDIAKEYLRQLISKASLLQKASEQKAIGKLKKAYELYAQVTLIDMQMNIRFENLLKVDPLDNTAKKALQQIVILAQDELVALCKLSSEAASLGNIIKVTQINEQAQEFDFVENWSNHWQLLLEKHASIANFVSLGNSARRELRWLDASKYFTEANRVLPDEIPLLAKSIIQINKERKQYLNGLLLDAENSANKGDLKKFNNLFESLQGAMTNEEYQELEKMRFLQKIVQLHYDGLESFRNKKWQEAISKFEAILLFLPDNRESVQALRDILLGCREDANVQISLASKAAHLADRRKMKELFTITDNLLFIYATALKLIPESKLSTEKQEWKVLLQQQKEECIRECNIQTLRRWLLRFGIMVIPFLCGLFEYAILQNLILFLLNLIFFDFLRTQFNFSISIPDLSAHLGLVVLAILAGFVGIVDNTTYNWNKSVTRYFFKAFLWAFFYSILAVIVGNILFPPLFWILQNSAYSFRLIELGLLGITLIAIGVILIRWLGEGLKNLMNGNGGAANEKNY